MGGKQSAMLGERRLADGPLERGRRRTRQDQISLKQKAQVKLRTD